MTAEHEFNKPNLGLYICGFQIYWTAGKSLAIRGPWVASRMKRPGFLNGGGFRPRKEQP